MTTKTNTFLVSQRFGLNLNRDIELSERSDLPEWAQDHVCSINTSHVFSKDVFNDLWEFDRSGYKDGCLYIAGPKGVGKSTTVEQFYARLGTPTFRFNCHAETDMADFIGGLRLGENGTQFQEGLLTLAARCGGIFIADEINAALPEALIGLHGVLEGGSFTIPETSEVVQVHPNFRIVATGNPTGGEYHGTNEMNEATLDRFNFLEWGYPDEEIEKQIILNAVPKMDAGLLDQIISFAQTTRVEGGVPAISTRSLIRWVRKITIFKGQPLKVSLDRSVALRYRHEDRKELYMVAVSIFGSKAFTGE